MCGFFPHPWKDVGVVVAVEVVHLFYNPLTVPLFSPRGSSALGNEDCSAVFTALSRVSTAASTSLCACCCVVCWRVYFCGLPLCLLLRLLLCLLLRSDVVPTAVIYFCGLLLCLLL